MSDRIDSMISKAVANKRKRTFGFHDLEQPSPPPKKPSRKMNVHTIGETVADIRERLHVTDKEGKETATNACNSNENQNAQVAIPHCTLALADGSTADVIPSGNPPTAVGTRQPPLNHTAGGRGQDDNCVPTSTGGRSRGIHHPVLATSCCTQLFPMVAEEEATTMWPLPLAALLPNELSSQRRKAHSLFSGTRGDQNKRKLPPTLIPTCLQDCPAQTSTCLKFGLRCQKEWAALRKKTKQERHPKSSQKREQ